MAAKRRIHKASNERTKLIATRLAHSMIADLNMAAKREGIALSTFVREAVSERLQRITSASGEAAGAVG